MKELVLGSGHKSAKILNTNGLDNYVNPVTLDINPDTNPEIVWDLNVRPLPFMDEEFDEIHAYEVLEHLGTQGDYKGFFEEFYEYWRILKPGGLLAGSCPNWNSIWAFGDPSHTRVLSSASFVFLSQDEYKKQIGKTAMSDFRSLWKGDFRLKFTKYEEENWYFILEKFNV
jgi:predicted SAM-dependent methyltransferase